MGNAVIMNRQVFESDLAILIGACVREIPTVGILVDIRWASHRDHALEIYRLPSYPWGDATNQTFIKVSHHRRDAQPV